MNRYLARRSVRTLLAGAMALIVACLGSVAFAAPGRVVWVATDGDDSASGDEARPLRTLEAARDRIRAMKKMAGLPEGGVVVRLKPGVYTRRATFELENSDSGTEGAPVVYEGVARDQTIVSGGVSIPGKAFRAVESGPLFDRLPAEARGQVVTANLRNHGFADLMRPPDSFESGGGMPSLFFGNKPMTMARWPNESYAKMGKALDKGGRKGKKDEAGRGGRFEYEEDRPARWKVDGDLFLRGYLRHDWHHEVFRVGTIDTTSKTITLARAGRYQVGGKWSFFEGRYIVFNAPEELDAPGEYTVDFATGDVAFWPPDPLTGRAVDFTHLEKPLVQALGASDIVFRNMTLELGRGQAFQVRNGERFRIESCTIRNVDQHAAFIKGGKSHGISGCEMYGMGQGGAFLWGGDRKTLTPAGHYMENCYVHDYGRLRRTYAGAAWIKGVGNRLSHCKIEAAPHTAVFYNGNEHTIEYNEMADLMRETGDAGATYTGRDWTSQGNVVRYNYIHDLGIVGAIGSNGIYLDDCDSGDTVHGNIVWKSRTGMLMGGGRDNTITNNIFVDCKFGFRADSRGTSRMKFDTKGDSWDLERKAEALNYTKPPWSERYPSLARTMEEMPTWPLHNEFARNVIVRCQDAYSFRGNAKEHLYMHDNLVVENDPGFVDMENGDFRLKSDSLVLQEIPGFERIPFEKIGLLK